MFNINEAINHVSKQKSLSEYASIVNNKIITDLQDVKRSATKAYITTADMTRMLEEKITPNAVRLYLFLYEQQGASVIPSMTEMASVLGLGRTATSQAKSLLTKKGYFFEDKLTRGAHRSHIIFLGRNCVGYARTKMAIRELMEREDSPLTEAALSKLAKKQPNGEFEELLLSTEAMGIYTSNTLQREALEASGVVARRIEKQLIEGVNQ
ncbi:MarR family transcriptional regulator [Vibrio crassostreae]|nr:MarR family transcriptional regulator [Vibrio crassostreae]CAK2335205.1 MarR family transcriptional regulator [Vibrio crassostreae]CAK2503623.1 MarR family transcriptional regulator [Vibrio crassostreae]CAK2910629.1 MarR family transcriptional regulator [Vibrio crassostreae]